MVVDWKPVPHWTCQQLYLCAGTRVTSPLKLEYANSASAQVWSAVTNTVAVIGDINAVQIDATAGERFYRLRGP